jgi:hypothetical protein
VAERLRARLLLELLEERDVPSFTTVVAGFVSPPLTTPENTPIALVGSPAAGGTSFAIFDVSHASDTFSADLIATNGTIDVDTTMTTKDGLTASNNGSADVNLVGSLANLNAFLASPGLIYTPSSWYAGDDAITLNVSDITDTSDPGASASQPVFVSPIADPPVLSVPTTAVTGSAGNPITLNVSASLADPNPYGNAAVPSVTFASYPAGSTFSTGTDNGDGTWTVPTANLSGLTITVPTTASTEQFDLQMSATSVTTATTELGYGSGGVDEATSTSTTAFSVALDPSISIFAPSYTQSISAPTTLNNIFLQPTLADPTAPASQTDELVISLDQGGILTVDTALAASDGLSPAMARPVFR